MAAKKKEIRKSALPAAATAATKSRILALYPPEKAKKTHMIGGSAAEAARELVRRLREDARVIQ
jgi:electron transfer flavoprotein alpha/beta subunit